MSSLRSLEENMFSLIAALTPDTAYVYNGAGQVYSVAVPTYPGRASLVLTTTYDSMARPILIADSTMTDHATQTQTYNVNGQLATLGWSGSGVITYGHSVTQDNGQITRVTDSISGETVVYQYDPLKRLRSAAATPSNGSAPPAWTENYAYDGFSNLTTKILNGTATTIGVNGSTNQLANASYDANGNMTLGVGGTLSYDEANRMSVLAPDNKRVYRLRSDGTEELTLYGARGEKLEVYQVSMTTDGTTSVLQLTLRKVNIYFAGRLIWEGSPWPGGVGGAVFEDRLGTNRASGARFRPYGNEITSTANDREKFGTYNRDGFSELDYADQRYYASTLRRFNTADPYHASAGPGDPGSWNRYSYTGGDPVNRFDPSGLESEGASDDCYLADNEGFALGACDAVLGRNYKKATSIQSAF